MAVRDGQEGTDADTLRVEGEPKSSARILEAIKKAGDHFNPWQAACDRIDDIYARVEGDDLLWADPDYDLFWASSEILKPAIYARPPKPVVSPMFNDRRPLYVTTADLLERSVTSAYEHGGIDEALLALRDDLIFYNRGVLWATYVSDDGQRVCIEHLDRKDFRHPPARKWSELPWAARCAWMTIEEMGARFKGDAYKTAVIPAGTKLDDEHEGKVPVWEVWHKADKRVYWVAEGVPVLLDDGKPHYDLKDFFPCPRPAYGTLRPRTLMPVPDYRRYAGHFQQINRLTRRIYALLDMVRMKGLIAAGGDLATAVQQLMDENDDASMLVQVPGALISGSGAANMVQWLPIAEIAAAITGLIEARRELFGDFDRLSGISDIMRGETEASETLGAQRLKGQYGSVRVREKTDEIVRISRDVTRIAAEIMAEHFKRETLLDMAQMEIPTRAEVKAEIEEIEEAAAEELKSLTEGIQQAAQGGEQADPQAAQQQLQQAQQEVLAKHGPMLKAASEQVPIEDVMKLLRDHRARNFAFEIETDSTILTDETEAKQAATEFYQAFTGGMAGLTSAAAMGPEVMRASAEVLKYTLSPYRPPRSVLAAIDDMLDAAPQIAERMAAQQGEGDQEAMTQLAQAELQKAQAQTMKVEADAQLKMQEMQLRAKEAQASASADQQRFGLEVEEAKGSIAKTKADIDKIHAEIMLAQQKLGLEAHRERREDARAAADIQGQQQDRAMAARQQAVGEAQTARSDARADRQQDFSERSGDRQMALAEQQAREGSK